MAKSELFNSLNRRSFELRESRDCTVLAAAVVTGATYDEAHAALKAAGRRSRRGSYKPEQMRALKALGATVEKWKPRKPNGGKYTVRTIGEVLHTGRHYVFVSRHALGVLNGVVHDWTDERLHEVIEVWTVTMPGDKPYELKRPTSEVREPTRASGVRVYVDGSNYGEHFSSVRRAFEYYDLTWNKHQKFRFNLKRSPTGELTYSEDGCDYRFVTTY